MAETHPSQWYKESSLTDRLPASFLTKWTNVFCLFLTKRSYCFAYLFLAGRLFSLRELTVDPIAGGKCFTSVFVVGRRVCFEVLKPLALTWGDFCGSL